MSLSLFLLPLFINNRISRLDLPSSHCCHSSTSSFPLLPNTIQPSTCWTSTPSLAMECILSASWCFPSSSMPSIKSFPRRSLNHQCSGIGSLSLAMLLNVRPLPSPLYLVLLLRTTRAQKYLLPQFTTQCYESIYDIRNTLHSSLCGPQLTISLPRWHRPFGFLHQIRASPRSYLHIYPLGPENDCIPWYRW